MHPLANHLAHEFLFQRQPQPVSAYMLSSRTVQMQAGFDFEKEIRRRLWHNLITTAMETKKLPVLTAPYEAMFNTDHHSAEVFVFTKPELERFVREVAEFVIIQSAFKLKVGD